MTSSRPMVLRDTFEVCGIEELSLHSGRNFSHVLSILDPGWPEPEIFSAFDMHHRTTLNFHDVVEELPGYVTPSKEHLQAILQFGENLASRDGEAAVLIHCHAGISRSTAAIMALMAHSNPSADEDEL